MHDKVKPPLAFVCGSLLGLVVGGALGVLFAPAKGTHTRRQLARKAEDLGDRAAALATESAHAARELAHRVA